jgi:hypothetical protein
VINRPQLLKVTTMSANTRRTARLGCELLEAREVPTVSSITGSFNKAPIAVGDALWFSSFGHVTHLPTDPSTIRVTGSSITFTAAGQPYTVNVPDTTINFTSTATQATTAFAGDHWVVTAPRKFDGDIFLGGAALSANAALPGGIKNVQWTNNITADAGAPRVRWQWGAAVYHANFSSLDQIQVKAVDDRKVDAFGNADPAGTPEAFKAFLVRGGTGNGGKQYVGKATASRRVSPDATPVSATGSLSGTLVMDSFLGDHQISPDDSGFAGITVSLVDANTFEVVATAVTDDNGFYSFTNVEAGTYNVVLDLSAFTDLNTMPPQVPAGNGTIDGSWAGVNGIAIGGSDLTGYNFGVYQTGF